MEWLEIIRRLFSSVSDCFLPIKFELGSYKNSHEKRPLQKRLDPLLYTFPYFRRKFHNSIFLVMIQTLKKDFSRFEEIQILRTVSVEEQKQAPVVKKLDREIKRTLRKKRKESY